jgi:hypothetical protein
MDDLSLANAPKFDYTLRADEQDIQNVQIITTAPLDKTILPWFIINILPKGRPYQS